MRPEEERSIKNEPQPEILVRPTQPNSPLERAQALVSVWEANAASPHWLMSGAVIVLTQDVRDRMRDDIAALLNDTISREHLQP